MTAGIVARVRAMLLSGIERLVRERQARERDLWRAALGVEHVILSDLLTRDEEREVLAGMESGPRQACPEIFCGLETMIENSFAAMTLGGNEAVILRADSITESYLNRYEELARREVASASIASRDRVLFVGSGPFPITAIEYTRQSGCTVDCVDFLAEAVDTSRQVVSRLDLSERIRCHLARGESVPASEYSVVLVGVLARPKQEIFANLEATCPNGCRIIARTTFGIRSLIYQPTEFDAGELPGLTRNGTSEAKGDQVISSVLWVKGR